MSRPADLPLPPVTPSADFPPAHSTYGHGAADVKLVQANLCAVVDELGAVPLFSHLLDGNSNGHTAIAQTFELLCDHLPPPDCLLVSDRGTFSAGHVARLHRHGYAALCSAPWADYRALFDAQRPHLHWQRASYLSIELQRRRDTNSTLPREYYDLAVVRHHLVDPDTKAVIPCRVLFIFSTADQKIGHQTRQKAVAKIQAGLEQLAATVQRGHPATTQARSERRLAKLLGRHQAARYFPWQWQTLTAQEQAALPTPARGCRRPTHRLVFHYDTAAAAVYDGYAVLVTTAARPHSADQLFTSYKQQNYVELLHHQWKTPLAVRPVFLKSPQRVEALVCLLQIALTAYQVLERLYRQSVGPEALRAEQRRTSESLLRQFASYGLLVSHTPVGRVVYATRLTSRQQRILQQLGFGTPAQLLSLKLRPPPAA